jgi:hypothetical protein
LFFLDTFPSECWLPRLLPPAIFKSNSYNTIPKYIFLLLFIHHITTPRTHEEFRLFYYLHDRWMLTRSKRAKRIFRLS